jgi:hypothetical protein
MSRPIPGDQLVAWLEKWQPPVIAGADNIYAK